jgi:hypothetical protein
MTTVRTTADGAAGATPPMPMNSVPTGRPQTPPLAASVQLLFGLYILLTGSVPTILQASIFGLQGGTGGEFALAMLAETVRDLLLFAPVVMLAGHPLRILHPLLIAAVLWPLLAAVPSTIDDYAGWAGFLAGTPVQSPYFSGLPGQSGAAAWLGVAKFKSLDIIRLLCVYLGFSLLAGKPSLTRIFTAFPRPQSVRVVMIVLIAISTLVLLFFVRSRGGLGEHLQSLGHGRFREVGGAGFVLVAIHLGAVALYVWTASRPNDVRNPLFLGCMAIVMAAQFVANGSRSAALEVPMMIGLVWALRKQRVPWRVGLIVAPLLFLSLGLLNAVRGSSWTRETAGETFVQTGVAKSFAIVQAEITERRSLDATVPVVERGFDLTDGPMLGRTYLNALFAPIPRTFWTDKPRGPDSLYAQLFLHESNEGRGIPIGETAELYWNFSIVGVAFFSVIYGWLIRAAYYFYWRRYPNPISIVLYAVFITTFHFATEDIVTMEQQFVLIFVCYAFISFMTQKVPPAGLNYEFARTPSGAVSRQTGQFRGVLKP